MSSIARCSFATLSARTSFGAVNVETIQLSHLDCSPSSLCFEHLTSRDARRSLSELLLIQPIMQQRLQSEARS